MIHHLRAAGVSFVLDSRGAGVPVIVHWGRDLGALSPDALIALSDATTPAVPPSSIDVPFRLSVLPHLAEGWVGRPAVAASGLRGVLETQTTRSGSVLVVDVRTEELAIETRLELTAGGLLLAQHTVRNISARSVPVTDAAVVLPIPDRAREVLDLSGRWAYERSPQRVTPGHGVWLRETRHGRGGHDDPLLMVAGTPGFSFERGEVWATHVAWSGDTRQWFERTAMGPAALGAGERLGDEVLEPGDSYTSPRIVAGWSEHGLDGLSDRFHRWVRSWSTIRSPRPVTLNTWEAVYFDQSLERMRPLVAKAAQIGVERFVLDDGWFSGRTDDRRALGDWTVDAQRWPDGLHPLADLVTQAGMQFGLWVEPEMISLDSDLARSHPEWLLTPADSVTWRHQHVLDLSQPDVADHLFARIDALLAEYPISYLKWDHNRDLLVERSRPQVLALYRLLDRLRSAHPDVEIESCASGGGRIDLEILRRVDRVWTSDSNDPLARQSIERWTGLLVPPEYLGSHVGDARAHTTGRVSDLGFRLATALFGHAGIESDLTALPESELTALAGWIAVHREHRTLLHTGRSVRIDSTDDAITVRGVISEDARSAVFSYAAVGAPQAALPEPLRLRGLDPDLRYRVQSLDIGSPTGMLQDAPPLWLDDGVVLPGAVLAEVGLAVPLLMPGSALLLSVTAI
ncbi:MAG: alpha-galactosidase [Actinomycetota bacterium]